MRLIHALVTLTLIYGAFGSTASSFTAFDASLCTIRSIDASEFPVVRLFVAALDDQGQPVAGLGASDFTVMEAGQTLSTLAAHPVRPGESSLRVVLAIDRSGSMKKGAALSAARDAAIDFVERLAAGDEVGLVAFDDRIETLLEPTEDHTDVLSRIRTIQTRGDTSLRDAISVALKLVGADEGARLAVVVLTDGRDTSSQIPRAASLGTIRSAGVPVFAVALGSRVALDYLGEAARSSGGRLLRAAKPEDLLQIYQAIAADIQAEYVVSYRALPGSEPAVRQVDIEVRAGANRGRDRSHYETPLAATRRGAAVGAAADSTTAAAGSGARVFVASNGQSGWLQHVTAAIAGAAVGLLVGVVGAWFLVRGIGRGPALLFATLASAAGALCAALIFA